MPVNYRLTAAEAAYVIDRSGREVTDAGVSGELFVRASSVF